jgi:hypothetical protein
MLIGSVTRRGLLEGLGADGKIEITDLKELWWEDVDCIHVAQDKGWWQALVNKVIKHQVP